MGQAGPVLARVGPHGEQGGHGEAGGPQQGGERQGAGEGGGAVGLLAQHHAQAVQGDHRHRLQGHDDEARAGEVEGEAEALGHAVAAARVQEQHQGEHGGGHAADEQVAEGQVQDHEVKVGAELAEGRVEEGEEHHQVAVGAQAEDEDEEERAGGQGGRVDHGPFFAGLGAQGAVEAQLLQSVHRVRWLACGVHFSNSGLKRLTGSFFLSMGRVTRGGQRPTTPPLLLLNSQKARKKKDKRQRLGILSSNSHTATCRIVTLVQNTVAQPVYCSLCPWGCDVISPTLYTHIDTFIPTTFRIVCRCSAWSMYVQDMTLKISKRRPVQAYRIAIVRSN